MSKPATHKAIVLSELKEPLELAIVDFPYPTVTPGSAIVKVLSALISSHFRLMFNGTLPYPFSLPMTPGGGGIGRIHEVGSDAVSLQPGQLVLITYQTKGRDDPSQSVLQGYFSGRGPAKKLSEGEWRNGTLAEYAKVALENVFPLDENILIKEMGYTYSDLQYALILLVPFGGFVDTGLKPGDTVLVAPATGVFSGSAVTLALALGARVIAAGRSEEKLKKMVDTLGPSAGGRLSYVTLTGDEDVDAESIKKASPGGKGVDIYIDFTPPRANTTTHITAGFKSLRVGGQISVMGGLFQGVTLPYFDLVLKSIKIKGKYMYEREDIEGLIRLMESGILKVGRKAGLDMYGPYKLDQIFEAISVAEKTGGWGSMVSIAPYQE